MAQKIKKSSKRIKINKEIYAPAYRIELPVLSKVLYKVWPKEVFNTILGIENCKSFYNDAYNAILQEIGVILNKYHPAGWVRESYIQLEAWTLLWFKNQSVDIGIKISGPKNFVAGGRYGWRYILETSLEKTDKSLIISTERPEKSDVSRVFTLLMALAQSAEMSNYLHFIPNYFKTVSLNFSPHALLNPPSLDKNEQESFTGVITLLSASPNYKLYPNLVPDENKTLMEMIDTFLEINFGFSLDEIRTFTQKTLSGIIERSGASIIVHSVEEIIEICSESSNLGTEKIKRIFDFILLDVHDMNYTQRDFLKKSQQKRMVNYCGAIIYLSDSLETIYTHSAANLPYIKQCKRHLMLSPILIAEWINNFVMRLVYGQRLDLKILSPQINNEISLIEEYFHKEIFEKNVISLLSKNNFQCINLKKYNGKELECGEIDVLAYRENSNELFIVESKNLAPTRDAKGIGQVVSDHFKQKKYHNKFLRKIEWVNKNLDYVGTLFLKEFNILFPEKITIHKFYVTGRESIVKFMVSDYEVLSFSEFDFFLKKTYDKEYK